MNPGVSTAPGAAGFEKVLLAHPSGARAEAHLWGATVTAWHPGSGADNVFWLDPRNPFDSSGPIRGGNPLVFPWFGPHPLQPQLPRHGFARTTPARMLQDRTRSPGAAMMAALPDSSDKAVGVSLLLDFTGPEDRLGMDGKRLPHCVVGLDVDLFSDRLRMIFSVRNEGDEPLDAEMLQHPYFAVGSALTARVRGLRGISYLDKNDGGKRKHLEEETLGLVPPPDHVFDARPPGDLVLERAPLAPLTIRRLTAGHTVVWNSGPARGQGPETAPPFACVEPGRIHGSAIRGLKPGDSDGLGIELLLSATVPNQG